MNYALIYYMGSKNLFKKVGNYWMPINSKYFFTVSNNNIEYWIKHSYTDRYITEQEAEEFMISML